MAFPLHSMTFMARPRLSAHVRIQWNPVREQHVLLIPEGVLLLNATAAAIVTLCDGHHCVSDIIATLSAQYHCIVEQEVLIFLDRLANKRLLDVTDEQGV